MSLVEFAIADLSQAASGAWVKDPIGWGPEESVENTFRAAIDYYTRSYQAACHILEQTRGSEFKGLPANNKREIILGLGSDCEENRHKFVEGFVKHEADSSYHRYQADQGTWGEYVAARQSLANSRWMVFTNLTEQVRVELRRYWGKTEVSPENIQFQTRLARHMGILGQEQNFEDLETDSRVRGTPRGAEVTVRELVRQQPNIIWALLMSDWRPYNGYMMLFGNPYYFMNFPTKYGDGIRASVRLEPNQYKDEARAMRSMKETLGSGLSYPVITIEIDPTLILPAL